MKVTLRRSGGFAGLNLRSEIDASQLGAKESSELQRLVSRLPAGQPPRPAAAAAAAARPMPDAMQYEVTVDDGNGPRTVRASDGAMPEELQELVDWIVENGK